MKLFTSILYLMAMANAIAQPKRTPLPSVIILCGTNLSAPITVIRTSAESWKEDHVKQQSVITNLDLTCMSAKSVTSTSEKAGVTLVLHEVTVYGPTVVNWKYGEDLKLQTMTIDELSIGLRKSQLVQVNGVILNADRFAQRFKTIPERNAK